MLAKPPLSGSSRVLLAALLFAAISAFLYRALAPATIGNDARRPTDISYQLDVPAAAQSAAQPRFRGSLNSALAIMVHPQDDGEIVIHGYLAPIPVEKGKPVLLRFSAPSTGLFPIHFHGEDGVHEQVGVIEIE